MTRVAFLTVLTLTVPAVALAQRPGGDRPIRRIEIAGGGGLLGGAALGGADAKLRGRGGSDFQLFSTESEFARASIAEVRAGYALSRRYAVEARLAFARPELRTTVSNDAENAPSLTVSERADQYVIDGSLIVLLDRLQVGRLVPFAAAGAGYLRQLHEGRTLVEQGTAYHLGGGVRQWLSVRNNAVIKAFGVRADARVYLFSGGISTDDGVRPHAAVSGSLFVTF